MLWGCRESLEECADLAKTPAFWGYLDCHRNICTDFLDRGASISLKLPVARDRSQNLYRILCPAQAFGDNAAVYIGGPEMQSAPGSGRFCQFAAAFFGGLGVQKQNPQGKDML